MAPADSRLEQVFGRWTLDIAINFFATAGGREAACPWAVDIDIANNFTSLHYLKRPF